MADSSSILDALTASVVNGLKDKTLTDADRPAARLAWAYASAIDEALGTETETATLKDLGPKLHALLGDLGFTPAGRRQPAKRTEEVTPDDSPGARIIALRGQFGKPGARQHNAPPAHATTA